MRISINILNSTKSLYQHLFFKYSTYYDKIIDIYLNWIVGRQSFVGLSTANNLIKNLS